MGRGRRGFGEAGAEDPAETAAIQRPNTPAVTNELQESPCRSTRNPREPPAPSSNESRCGIVSVYNEVERAVADTNNLGPLRAVLSTSLSPPHHQPSLHEWFEQ